MAPTVLICKKTLIYKNARISLLLKVLYMSLIRNAADKIQIQGKKKGTQNTKHNDENSLRLKQN